MPLTRLCNRCRTIVTGDCPTCDSGWAAGRTGRAWSVVNTGDRRWRRVRALQLKRYPYCARCGAKATQVDHLDGADYTDATGRGASWLSLAMLRSLCSPCHRRRTSEQGGRARGQ